MRVCLNCQKEYKPSSRHKICPACRGRLSKNSCACGSLKRRVSPTCIACSIKFRVGDERFKGSASANWKGGRIVQNGYVKLSSPEHHPRVPKSDRYIFEHILVMEAKIGRYLLPGENVHHLNGVKDDNRIENLELWTKAPMAGIRATDAIAWANQIISQYGIPDNIAIEKKPTAQRIIMPLSTSKGYLKKGYRMMMAPKEHPKNKTGRR